jgi:hypothetical protein
VNHGGLGEREVDFVCDRAGRRWYVQAAYLLADPGTREREFGNLLAIADNHPKCVVPAHAVLGAQRHAPGGTRGRLDQGEAVAGGGDIEVGEDDPYGPGIRTMRPTVPFPPGEL